MEEKILQKIAGELTRNNDLLERRNALLEQRNVFLEAIVELGVGFINIQASSIPSPSGKAEGNSEAAKATRAAHGIIRKAKSDGKSQAERTAEKLGNM